VHPDARPVTIRGRRGDPRRIHHLARDAEFLIELPEAVQVLRIFAGTAIPAALRR